MATLIMRGFATAVGLLSLGVLVYVYVAPMDSIRVSRDGVPYFTPSVLHPETGEEVSMDVLVRHYRGD